MSFLSQYQVEDLKNRVTSDISILGKIYKARKGAYQHKSVDHSLVDHYLSEGWEEEGQLKTKTKIRKLKTYFKKFEDDIWCQLYELGYRTLNIDENFILPFSQANEDKKQIDVVAIDKDSILIFECKSNAESKGAPSYKDEFDLLRHRMEGYNKALKQAFGEKKVRFVFATRNIRLSKDSDDFKRLENVNAYYYNDNTYDYVNNLISKYKKAALYQFYGLIFKHQTINSRKIEVPALRGLMGGKEYFMFSLEPTTLLKLGFVLHRTRANEAEFPTYQRLLVPARLSGITKFIDNGGYFPNSIIINFNTKKQQLSFEASARIGDSNAKAGILKIPNAYAIAYIIDGQHRVYGYANSRFVETNTIPVVAFNNLESSEQLEMFMDINQNQKAVSPSLKLDLEEDLYWDSDRADSRLKALKSAIIKQIVNDSSSPLYKRVTIGEDRGQLQLKPFYSALTGSGLLPIAKGNKYSEQYLDSCLYNIGDQNHSREMSRVKKEVSSLLVDSYELVAREYSLVFNDEKSLIISNRGTYAFVSIIGSFHAHAMRDGIVDKKSSAKDRFNAIKDYLTILLDGIMGMNQSEKNGLLEKLGSGADTEWLRHFQNLVSERAPSYRPSELIDWKERQDQELQHVGWVLVKKIEAKIKEVVLSNLKILFGDNWELEINSIKRECLKRAEEEKERNYKEGLGTVKVEWTDMFNINDYKTVISKYWTMLPKTDEPDFNNFEQLFSIKVDESFNSKAEKLKWLSYFNSCRNASAHEGTKGRGLNKKEVELLKSIAQHLKINMS